MVTKLQLLIWQRHTYKIHKLISLKKTPKTFPTATIYLFRTPAFDSLRIGITPIKHFARFYYRSVFDSDSLKLASSTPPSLTNTASPLPVIFSNDLQFPLFLSLSPRIPQIFSPPFLFALAMMKPLFNHQTTARRQR